jgi:putative amidase-like protein/Big-like domain-containing protein
MLGAAFLSVASSPASAGDQSIASPSSTTPEQQALAQADATGDPVAVTADFTQTTQVFANPDGTLTANIAPGPMQVTDPTSDTGWQPIDTTLQQTPDGIQPVATVSDMTFSDGGAGQMASMDVGTKSFGLTWPDPLPAPTLSGDTATYANVLPGVDLTLQAKPEGFEHSYIVNAPPTQPLVLRFPLDLQGLHASVNSDGNLILTDNAGVVKAQADPARMWGATMDPNSGEPTQQTTVETQVINTSNGPVLQVTPDAAFLANPDVSYPVTVDPSPDLTVAKDAYIESDFPNNTYNNDTILKSGSFDSGSTKARSFIKFNIGAINNTHIINATLKLWENWSYSCTNSQADIYALTTAFSSPTWNSQPTYGAMYASRNVSLGYSSSCPAGQVSFSQNGASGKVLADLVQKWADGTMDNNGVAVRADDESDSQGWKKYNSAENANNQPILTVNYNSFPATPTSLSSNLSGIPAVTLHGVFSDPDGGQGQVAYTVYDPSGSPVSGLSNVLGSQVASGSDSPVTIQPNSGLVDGTSYTWKARGFDGTDYSKNYSAPGSFTYDTSPSVPWGVTPQDGNTFNVTGTTNPSFVGMYTDSNGGSGQLRFQLLDAGCNTVQTSALGSLTTDGSLSVWTPSPALGLTMGTQYAIRARAEDSSGTNSAYSPCSVFEVDTTLTAVSPDPTQPSSQLRPVLTATLGADAPGSKTPTFAVYRRSDGTQVASGTGSSAAPGQNSTWTVPQSVLSADSDYYWVASAGGAEGTGQQEYQTVSTGTDLSLSAPLVGDELDGVATLSANPTGFDTITSVTFSVDGTAVQTVTTSPWETDFAVPTPGGNHTIAASVTGVVGGVTMTRNSPNVSVTYAAANNDTSLDSVPDPTQAQLDQAAQDWLDEQAGHTQPIHVSADRMISYALCYSNDSGGYDQPRPQCDNGYNYIKQNDCANFASQQLLAAGWRYANAYSGHSSPTSWWWQTDGAIWDWTDTWVNASSLYHFAIDTKRGTPTQLDPNNPAHNLVHLGDLIFIGENADHLTHVMTVTDITRNQSTGAVTNIFVTAHTKNRRQHPFFNYNGESNFSLSALHPHVDWSIFHILKWRAWNDRDANGNPLHETVDQYIAHRQIMAIKDVYHHH